MAAPRALPLIVVSLPHHNTYLKVHSRLHPACKFRWTYHLAIFSMDDFIVTPLNESKSCTISTMKIYNIVEILVAKLGNLTVTTSHDSYLPGRTKHGLNWYGVPQVTDHIHGVQFNVAR